MDVMIKDTIRDCGSTALFTAYTVYIVYVKVCNQAPS